MPPNSQLLAENREIIYAEPERQGGTNKKAGPITSAQIGVYMHTKEHVEPLIVRVGSVRLSV